MAKRKYAFQLPYEISGVYAVGLAHELANPRPEVSAALNKIHRLNPALGAKLDEAGFWHPIEITQADLDSLPDDVWAPVATRLNLKWSH